MRLHRLEVTAFGPFAGTVTVDLDDLARSGLFLLAGPTGAGKTSILDAVCFGLYGDVPGDRSQARRLRCDRAPADVAPRVQLDATLSGRRFRLVRSPAWERPKRRGTGTTRQQASVTVSERLDGQWQPLTSRLDEAGQLVADLLGMNLTQFTQVAMLPQGRFQAFLRARSEERHQLLQRLFRTGRFEDVERWLRERRVTLRRRSEVCQREVADLVSRVSEAAASPPPEAWDLPDLASVAQSGELTAWLAELHRHAGDRAAVATATAERAAERETRAGAALDDGRARHDQHRRVRAALDERDRLDADGAAHRERIAELDAARRSAAVVPLHRRLRALRAEADEQRAAADRAAGEAAELLDVLLVDAPTSAAAAAAADEAAARVRAALPRQDRLDRVRELLGDHGVRRRWLTTETERVRTAAESAPDRLERLRAELSTARTAAAQRDGALERHADLRVRLVAHREAAAAATELEQARAEWLAVRERALGLHEELLALRQARIEGMAAEIAGGLAVGACCPVCGSADHPDKATASPEAPGPAAERAAQRALDDARADEHARDVRVRELQSRVDRARGRAGDATAEELAGELARLDATAQQLHVAAGRVSSTTAELAVVEREHVEATDTLRRLEAELAALDSAEHHLREEEAALGGELRLLLAGTGAADLHDLLETHLARATACREACRTLEAAAAAARAAADADDDVRDVLREAGFDSVEPALAAARSTQEQSRLAEAVRHHDRRWSVVRAVLDDPGLSYLLDLDAAALPDLDVLTAQHAATRDDAGAARAEATSWIARQQRLAGLVDLVEAALTRWRPVREELELTAGLASFVEGRSPDNRLQMRLSAYVLAYRLAQVVDAANARLARMSDRRYALEHTGRRAAGETRGGLSLAVRDEWSGEARDPATLSGGETFVVSLALALGLADVIAQEAGGAQLDTLFVDEGFGSLDADTLDDVMDVLDELRDGGRVVGVVSHVPELRDRIPTRLEVAKGRGGSTARTVHAG